MSMKIFISGLVLSFITFVPLGIKWELEKRTIIAAAFIIGIMSWSIVNGTIFFVQLNFYQILSVEVLVIAATSISFLLWRFYRDPERVPPDIENVILSPADGRIIYVKKIEKGNIPFSEKNGRKFPLNDFVQADVLKSGGHLLGIAMNYLDVHVNRSPIGGRISLLKHIKGIFLSLKIEEAVIQNERVFSIIDNGLLKVGIVQIASRMVRKIVPYIQEGQEVQRGQRIGIICFGSQVDLILPDMPSLRVEVKPGEKVKAGVSIIATFEKDIDI